LEPEITEQTQIAQLRLEKDMLLHHVKNLLPDMSSLESILRAFEGVIERLTTNKVHMTPAPNTSQPPPGLFVICGSSAQTTGVLSILGSAEPTPGTS
jgi:signal-transduction protein with cAMP-binding, CBS, and nucleotidyltransferase domain